MWICIDCCCYCLIWGVEIVIVGMMSMDSSQALHCQRHCQLVQWLVWVILSQQPNSHSQHISSSSRQLQHRHNIGSSLVSSLSCTTTLDLLMMMFFFRPGYYIYSLLHVLLRVHWWRRLSHTDITGSTLAKCNLWCWLCPSLWIRHTLQGGLLLALINC